MRVLFINAVCGIRSTGRICTDIAKEYEKIGYEVKIAYGRANVPEQYSKYSVRIGNGIGVCWHALMAKTCGDRGYWSKSATRKFLEWADEYDPDILWIHNIHDYYINIEMLFAWIKNRPNMKIKWTQHDCWAFTGYCSYFSYINCDKWKIQCETCPQVKNSRMLVLDRSRRNYNKNKQLFTGINNMTLISPSKWLADLLKQSFLKEYDIKVIHNSIDKNVFKPTAGHFRQDYNLENKIIILGVANPWSKRKGLKDFLKLSSMLDNRYVIVLVGISEKQREGLPNNVIGILKTDSAKELAGLYTTADIFVNLTYEDNYPTTNLEAQACGTSVLTYRTGGSPESVPNRNVCNQGDIRGMFEKIVNHDYDGALILDNEYDVTMLL